ELGVLEIFLIVWMCRKLSAMVRAKGRSPAGYCTMLVFFWFGGEFLGAVCGMLISGERAIAYMFALAVAVMGALGAFAIVRTRTNLRGGYVAGGFPVIPLAVNTTTEPPSAPDEAPH